jgi:1-acyl-sn-glycerol-3-phosphate acyltransferase
MFQKTWYMIGRNIVDQYVRNVMKADIHYEAALPDGPKIIAVNHPSTNDPAFVTALFKEQVSILILETLFKVPLFGRSLRMAGHVPVMCGNGRAALEEGIRLVKSGRSVMIFPEGVISPAEGFHKAHTGIARLALATGAPVVPVGISLDHRLVRFVTTKEDQEPGAWYLHGPYAMTVGEAVTFTGDPNDYTQVRSITNQVMERVGELKHRGQHRLAVAHQVGAARTTRRNVFARAGYWMKYSVAFRAIQMTLMFLVGSAGKI